MTKLSSLIPPLGRSKYELSVIAAREARRLNEWSRRTGEAVIGKPTATALEQTIRGEVPFEYDEDAK